MNNIQALILYVFVALVALLVGVFLNIEAGLITFFILFFLATIFIILRREGANPLHLER
jgi:hypothetical protein